MLRRDGVRAGRPVAGHLVQQGKELPADSVYTVLRADGGLLELGDPRRRWLAAGVAGSPALHGRYLLGPVSQATPFAVGVRAGTLSVEGGEGRPVCEPTWWQILSPVWLFRAKPTDFAEPDGSPCSGPFALRGLTGLLAVHFVSFGLPLTLWLTVGGDWWLWLLTLPALLLWAVLIPADIRFRLQKPTRDQRDEFDSHVINWFGCVTWPVLLPTWSAVSVVGLVWWVVSLFV